MALARRDILAVEVTAAALRCLRLRGLGSARSVRAYTERRLPSGLVVPSMNAPNVQDEAAFSQFLAEAVGPRPPRQARLALPDRAVRLQVLPVDGALSPGADLRRFLVWRLQGALPFSSGEARVAYLAAPDGLPSRRMALTLVAREQVVAQYERLLRTAGTTAAHLAPAACHLFNLAYAARPAGPEVEAFLALGRGAATLFLARRGFPYYVRSFLPPGVPAALAPQLTSSFGHAEEVMDLGPPARLCLAGEESTEATRDAIEAALGLPCTLLTPCAQLRGAQRLPAEARAVLGAALAQV